MPTNTCKTKLRRDNKVDNWIIRRINYINNVGKNIVPHEPRTKEKKKEQTKESAGAILEKSKRKE